MILSRWRWSRGVVSQRGRLRAIAEFLVVGVCTVGFLLAIGGICAALLGRDSAGTRDFVEYWASGQQLVHRANPYNADAILRIERSAGFPAGHSALIMANPPSALPLALPLSFVGARRGWLLWSLMLVGCLVASVWMIWIMHGRPKNQLHFLGYSFAPAILCLMGGQVSLLVLLGLVLFLRLHRSRPFLAGVSLWLCLLKPHLFLPFGLVLLVWAIITRSHKLLAGVAVALAASTVVAVLLDPLAWVHYGQMMSSTRIDMLPIPCLSIMLRRKVSPNTIWLQFLPVALGCVWALAYFRRHRDDWNWGTQGSLLMLVSLLVAPYTWFTDQALLIPALLHGVYFTRSRSLIAILALGSAIIEVANFRGLPPLHSPFYIWTAPAWLAWYLYATRRSYATNVCEPPLLADGGLMVTLKD
jgi:uncharacterized integral membrane protein